MPPLGPLAGFAALTASLRTDAAVVVLGCMLFAFIATDLAGDR